MLVHLKICLRKHHAKANLWVSPKIPFKKRLEVKTVTTGLSSAMMLTVRTAFPGAKLINDRFHVQQLMSEAVAPVTYPSPLGGT